VVIDSVTAHGDRTAPLGDAFRSGRISIRRFLFSTDISERTCD
jgi:hypothetical protein